MIYGLQGFYLVGVDTVVYKSPADSACVEWQGDTPVDDSCNSGPAEKGAPVEGQSLEVKKRQAHPSNVALLDGLPRTA